MNVAIYLRKSRSDPEDESIEETLSRHKKTLLQYAKKASLTVTKIYEEVVSGDGLFVRPQMVLLMQDIENDKYDGVLCIDIDRLGRVDTKDRGIILDTFKTHNTLILTPNKTYNLNDELDEFSTEIQMLFARQELKKITARLQAGMKRTVQDGYHIGEPPYGYRRTYIGKRPSLEICEEEAQVIRMVFDMYVNQGLGSYTIAKTLNSMGLKPRKNDIFSRTTIQFYLQNETYIGKIIWNRRHHVKKKSPTDKHHQTVNPKEEWIVSEGVHPAIIDEETFNKAQEIRLTRSHPPCYKGYIENPFAGIMKCKNCGATMIRQLSPKCGPRLLCPTTGCNKSSSLSKIEKSVLQSLENILNTYKLKAAQSEGNEQNTHINTIQTQILETKKKLFTLKKQKEKLHDLLEQGVYDIPTFTERGQVISSNISTLEATLEDYQKQIKEISAMPSIKEALPTLNRLVYDYYSLSVEEKNNMMKQLIEVIYYQRDKTDLKHNFSVDVIMKQWL